MAKSFAKSTNQLSFNSLIRKGFAQLDDMDHAFWFIKMLRR